MLPAEHHNLWNFSSDGRESIELVLGFGFCFYSHSWMALDRLRHVLAQFLIFKGIRFFFPSSPYSSPSPPHPPLPLPPSSSFSFFLIFQRTLCFILNQPLVNFPVVSVGFFEMSFCVGLIKTILLQNLCPAVYFQLVLVPVLESWLHGIWRCLG